MESKKEVTAVDYDGLLKIFCSKDDLRASMQQPNTVGEKTYATDAHALIIIPNSFLKDQYGYHEKTPDFNSVLEAVQPCTPERYKDTDLFNVLKVHPKEYDTAPCRECDGRGSCDHCGADCMVCNGAGYVEDKSLPMIYAENGTIQIGEQYFFPLQLGRLEKVIVEMMEEAFTIIGRSKMAALFKVGPVEVLICRIELNGYNKLPNTVLTPIQ
jgi:hypothetical protein